VSRALCLEGYALTAPIVLRNEAATARVSGDVTSAGSAPVAVHRRLPGYRPTPVVDHPRLAERLGVGRVIVKDETTRLGLPAFKMLGASYAVYRVLVERLGHEPAWETVEDLARAAAPLRPLELITATDGNHGCAVARMARLLRLDARILVPAGTAGARIAAIRAEGAVVEEVDGDYDTAVRRSAERAGSQSAVVSDTSWPGYETTPRHVVHGYSTIFAELDEQLGGTVPDAVIVQCGVGAFAAATIGHYKDPARPGRPPTLLGVEPADAACVLASIRAGTPTAVPGPHRSIMAGLNCGTVSRIAWPLLRSGMDVLVAIDDEWTRRAMRDLAMVGIAAGETGAASLAAGLALVGTDQAAEHGLSPDATVLLVCTEGPTDPEQYAAIVGPGGLQIARGTRAAPEAAGIPLVALDVLEGGAG
jgi:diaminopropionate ammonia-lyase